MAVSLLSVGKSQPGGQKPPAGCLSPPTPATVREDITRDTRPH